MKQGINLLRPYSILCNFSGGGVTIVNDTVIADPLLTVPIRIMNPDTIGLDHTPFLCYEMQGRGNTYFNLISDSCVSVNAHYITVGPFNVINQIAVRAVDNSDTCRNILVDADNECYAEMDGASIDEYAQAEVSVRVFKERVRISVPNCDNQKLVMWVICENGSLQLSNSDSDRTVYEARMIKFVVARGFNLQPTSHGIIGKGGREGGRAIKLKLRHGTMHPHVLVSLVKKYPVTYFA